MASEILLLFSILLHASVVNGEATTPSPGHSPLDIHIHQLEQIVSDLQDKYQALEQKQTVVLTSVLAKLQALESEHNSTLLELSEIKNWKASAEVELQSCKNNYTSTKNQLTSNAGSLNNATKELMVLKNELSKGCCSAEVGYQTILTSDLIDNGDEVALKFDIIKYNAGDGYNKSSGMFVAPVAGSYLFWCHVMNDDKYGLHLGLHHNRDYVAEIHTDLLGGFASITYVLHLTEGDRVWFETQTHMSKIHGSGYSSIGGTLLRAN